MLSRVIMPMAFRRGDEQLSRQHDVQEPHPAADELMKESISDMFSRMPGLLDADDACPWGLYGHSCIYT